MIVMEKALCAKFSSDPELRKLLKSTDGAVLIEASPHDLFWGAGRNGAGQNNLGCLLMKLRSRLLSGPNGSASRSTPLTASLP